MNVLVMCAGEQSRITVAGDVPKQMLTIGKLREVRDGVFKEERIIERTVRMVRELVAGSVGVCFRADRSEWWRSAIVELGLDVDYFAEVPGHWTLIENIGIAAGARYAGGEVLVLLGDVVWSRAALELVLRHPAPGPVFFGRRGPNIHTAKSYGEIFALRCDARWSALEQHSAKAMLWELYRIAGEAFVSLPGDDWTDDVDTDEDALVRLPMLRVLAAGDP